METVYLSRNNVVQRDFYLGLGVFSYLYLKSNLKGDIFSIEDIFNRYHWSLNSFSVGYSSEQHIGNSYVRVVTLLTNFSELHTEPLK
jgi:hypothetical protein